MDATYEKGKIWIHADGSEVEIVSASEDKVCFLPLTIAYTVQPLCLDRSAFEAVHMPDYNA